MTMPIAQYVVSLGIDGRVVSQGTVTETLAKDDEMRKEAMESELAEKKADEVEATEGKEEKKPNDGAGKLVMAEEVAEGHVSFKSGASCLCFRIGKELLTIVYQSNYTSSTLEEYRSGFVSLEASCFAICLTSYKHGGLVTGLANTKLSATHLLSRFPSMIISTCICSQPTDPFP